MFNWSEVHLYRSNFLKNRYFNVCLVCDLFVISSNDPAMFGFYYFLYHLLELQRNSVYLIVVAKMFLFGQR